jgi:hypothetical protein
MPANNRTPMHPPSAAGVRTRHKYCERGAPSKIGRNLTQPRINVWPCINDTQPSTEITCTGQSVIHRGLIPDAIFLQEDGLSVGVTWCHGFPRDRSGNVIDLLIFAIWGGSKVDGEMPAPVTRTARPAALETTARADITASRRSFGRRN